MKQKRLLWLGGVALAVGAATVSAVIVIPADGTGAYPTGNADRAQQLGRSSGLLPLPAGSPQVNGGDATVERVSLDQAIERSSVVFIGVPVARGGSEEVTAAGAVEPGVPAMTAHRVRFEIRKMLRGDDASAIDLMILDISHDFDKFILGSKYVVFAEWRELGESRTPGLVPTGYYQGSFKFANENADVAENPVNGTLDVRELEKKLKEGR
ncbi:MAG TPA: hypothetical protein VJZ25_05965 [Gemmatimonadaceae bacterium]|nr:hypothetical protein [Gemmatimonadaceae bacterium]